MKKTVFMVLLAVCLMCLLTVSVNAADDPVDRFRQWETDGYVYHLPPILVSLLSAFLSIIPAIASLIEKAPDMLEPIIYVLIVLVLLPIAVCGYRSLSFMRATLGAVAGFFAGYLSWKYLITLTFVPDTILRYQDIIMWIVVVSFVLIGAVLTVILRRIGAAFSTAVITTSCLLPCIRNVWILIVAFVLILVFAFFKSRTSVILLTSFGITTFLMFLLVGPNGFYPVNFAFFVSSAVDPVLLVSLAVGTVVSVIHFRLARRVRA